MKAQKMNYETMRLEELAAFAKSGDDEALRLIYSQSKEMLRSKANLYFMVGADRDDVIQEGMIGLLAAIRTFDLSAGASFKTFAELCVKRRIINAVKMASRKKHMPLNESVSFDAAVRGIGANPDEGGARAFETFAANEETDPEEIVLLADLLDYIENNAAGLFSPLEGEVWAAYAQGSGAAQIAERLGKTPKSIDNALTRIKGKIEKLVAMY